MQKLNRYESWQVSSIGVRNYSTIGKRNQYYAIVPDAVGPGWHSERITRQNYLAIKKAWQGAECIGETGLATWITSRDYHTMQAFTLGLGFDPSGIAIYSAWQAENASRWAAGRNGINYYNWRPSSLPVAV